MNMTKLIKPLLLAMTLLPCQLLLASYDGPVVDYNFTMQKPAEYLICEQDRFNASLNVYKMCAKAQNAAEAFADRYGAQEGMLEGYLRGYAWGLHKNIRAYESNGEEMQRGADNVESLGEYFQIAIDAAKAKGEEDGIPRGAQDVRTVFQMAVNTNTFPGREYQVPPASYTVEDNAYQTHVLEGRNLQNASDILSEDTSLGEIPIFGSMQGTTLRDREYRRPFHYWHPNRDSRGRMTEAGVYRFETGHWHDGRIAFQVWKDRSGANESINYYENLLVTQERAPGYTNPDGTVVLGPLLSDLYKEVYEKSYKYWANYFFSRSFHQQIDLGHLVGENLGMQIGKRVAYEKGLAQEFNRLFVESGKEEYRRSFSEAYSSSYETTYENLANNPHLELKFDYVTGEINDGIIQPGEKISATFTVTNIGGVGSDIYATLDGDVQNAQVESGLNIAALSKTEYTTSLIAQIDPRLMPRDTATITLILNGELEDTLGQTVNRLVEITNKELALDVLTGSGQMAVIAKNLSTAATPGFVSAIMNLDGKSYQANGGRLNPGQEKRLILAFNGIDPLNLIKDKLIAEITILHRDDQLDLLSHEVFSSNPHQDGAKYFNEISNSKGTIPAYTTEEIQLEKVMSYLVDENKQEVEINSRSGWRNMYRKEPLTTIVGKMASIFESQSQNQLSKDRYHEASKIMIKEAKKFRSFLGIGPKRKHYRKQVRIFSKDKKLK